MRKIYSKSGAPESLPPDRQRADSNFVEGNLALSAALILILNLESGSGEVSEVKALLLRAESGFLLILCRSTGREKRVEDGKRGMGRKYRLT